MAVRSVICVLKSGQWHSGQRTVQYSPKTVQWLKHQVEQFAPPDTPFICLSNVKIDGVDTIPLQHDWPGWWSKMEMYRHDLGPVLYMDLDTVLVGNIAPLLWYPHKFTALQSLTPYPGARLNSGLLAWDGARPDIYEPFAADPEKWIRKCVTGDCWGDQGFLQLHVKEWEAWQDLFPGQVGSYKNTWNKQKPPSTARVVCFHGAPKPHEVNHDWVPRGYL